MKRWIITALVVSFLCAFSSTFAMAEDYSQYSDEELISIRDEINNELGRRIKDEKLNCNLGESLGKIKDIFPDEALAMVVRDKLAKFSIEQTVTQEELDTIKHIQLFSSEHGDFEDLTGIGHLRNLTMFSLYNSMEYKGKSFPDEFYTLVKLETIEVEGSNLEVLSPLLGNLINLETLDLRLTKISELPESIGNLTKLKELDIGYTNITSLPDSIWNLNLTKLNMAGLPIK